MNTAPVNLIENALVDFSKMYCQQCPFLLQQMLFLISKKNLSLYRRLMSLIKGDYSNLKHFKKCNGIAGSIVKSCKKWMAAYKDKFRKMLSSLFKYNQPKTEIPESFYKMGSPSVKLYLISWLFIIPFNFGYIHIINSTLKKCTH